MRCLVVCTVAALGAALSTWGIGGALAELGGDDPAPAEIESDKSAAIATDSDAAKNVPHFLLFSGADVWRNGVFMHGGFLYAHQGPNQDGPVFKLLLNGGLYRYSSGTTEITGRQIMGAALPGWRWYREGLEVTVFAGVDVQDHRFLPDDTGNRLRGTHVGVRGGFDAWYEPLHDGMVTASASLSTVGSSYWTRAAAGWRLFGVWAGPEFLAGGDDTYRQLRIGGHITSFRLSSYEFSLGAGWATDTDRRSGAYGRVGVLYRPFSAKLEKAAPF
jgi:hypothetical protein